jgi:Ca2+:H+ antiporter
MRRSQANISGRTSSTSITTSAGTSLNLALGSALATIGLTIPTVAAVSIVISQPIQLGLDGKDMVLLMLTLLLSVITLGTSRTTVLQGIVHLVMFAVFLFFAVIP